MNKLKEISNYIAVYDWQGLLIQGGTVALRLVLIIVIYILVKKMANSFIKKFFSTFEKKHSISQGRAYTLESLALNFVSYLLLFILFVTILQTFGIKATAILAGAGIIGVAVGIGAQGLVSDIVTGFFLLLEKQLDVGDSITIGEFSGTVEQIGLRTTQLRSPDGTLNYLPNREITILSNHSRGDMQALVDILISADNNIAKTLEILQNVCDTIKINDASITDGPHVVGIQSLGPATITIRIITKTVNNEQWRIERLIRQEIKEALDKNGIKLPPASPVLVAKEEI
ncbi:mechanosensitive ion channel family protein [Niallia sp. NCCP-28]|uniref:mechanosensitive ion channel family protein n=1 Tax=Niallia sp. NCCP-28 TaxID=2934712 RepID=UPI0020899DBB|nr:mechanosensitive ion channel family protein [Niallia sp. NCCP-28]GKU82325.1 putative MscS family protein YkuT [Niallia sp. NCCP-28]